jgi:hypothetical protein
VWLITAIECANFSLRCARSTCADVNRWSTRRDSKYNNESPTIAPIVTTASSVTNPAMTRYR